MREVKEKRLCWRKYPADKKAEPLGRHMIPVIFAPKERYYVVDHRHLAFAFHEEA
ncbi:ParB-like protein [Methylocella tundrae]|nr:ParB-like protein [Methylocella tundrae]